MARLSTPLVIVFAFSGILVCGCSDDAAGDSTPRADAAADAPDPDAGGDDAATPDAPDDAAPDAEPDAPVEAGPTDCTEPCATACADHTAIEGECATCVDTVCGEYKQRAESAPNREVLFTCIADCGSTPGCANDCCSKYAKACAFETAYEYCTCGFPESECTATCADSCSATGLTQACGVCASQSPCTLTMFDYLFAADRFAHQDCVDTCTSSALSLEECLDRCRNDYPEPGGKYDAFLACVCDG